MLNTANNFKVPSEHFIFEALTFCIKNGEWNILKKFSLQVPNKNGNKMKTAISIVNFNLAKKNLLEGNKEKQKIYFI